MKFDLNFWFTQPPFLLSKIDQSFGYFFVALLIISLILAVVKLWIRQPVKFKLVNKFFHLFLTIGFCGAIWYGFRYENTPIFDMYYWVALIILIGLIWLIFILKYLAVNFFVESREYNHELVKSKYLPGQKSR